LSGQGWLRGVSDAGFTQSFGHGLGGFGESDSGMASWMSVETSRRVPFLALEMNTVLLYVLYSLSAADVDEHAPVVVRLVYLALWVQTYMDYQARIGVRRAGGGAGGSTTDMEEDSPMGTGVDGEQSLEALILAEMKKLDLPTAHTHQPSGSCDNAVANVDAELGSLETYVQRCTLPFLWRARLLLCVLSGDMAMASFAPDNADGRAGAGALAAEWRASVAALRLPVEEMGGGLMPQVGEYSRELVRGWLSELEAARHNSCWALVWQAFARPQDLGFPLLIPLPDLYHDLYMTYRWCARMLECACVSWCFVCVLRISVSPRLPAGSCIWQDPFMQ
jgi:hypothetical protein